MTIEIWNTVWQSLVMGFAFLVPFVLCRFSDIVLGLITVIKTNKLTFDKSKFWNGILTSLLLIIGLATLIAGITMIPELLKYYEIPMVDAEMLSETINVLVIVTTIVMSALTYGRDAYMKFKAIIGSPSEE